MLWSLYASMSIHAGRYLGVLKSHAASAFDSCKETMRTTLLHQKHRFLQICNVLTRCRDSVLLGKALALWWQEIRMHFAVMALARRDTDVLNSCRESLLRRIGKATEFCEIIERFYEMACIGRALLAWWHQTKSDRLSSALERKASDSAESYTASLSQQRASMLKVCEILRNCRDSSCLAGVLILWRQYVESAQLRALFCRQASDAVGSCQASLARHRSCLAKVCALLCSLYDMTCLSRGLLLWFQQSRSERSLVALQQQFDLNKASWCGARRASWLRCTAHRLNSEVDGLLWVCCRTWAAFAVSGRFYKWSKGAFQAARLRCVAHLLHGEEISFLRVCVRVWARQGFVNRANCRCEASRDECVGRWLDVELEALVWGCLRAWAGQARTAQVHVRCEVFQEARREEDLAIMRVLAIRDDFVELRATFVFWMEATWDVFYRKKVARWNSQAYVRLLAHHCTWRARLKNMVTRWCDAFNASSSSACFLFWVSVAHSTRVTDRAVALGQEATLEARRNSKHFFFTVYECWARRDDLADVRFQLALWSGWVRAQRAAARHVVQFRHVAEHAFRGESTAWMWGILQEWARRVQGLRASYALAEVEAEADDRMNSRAGGWRVCLARLLEAWAYTREALIVRACWDAFSAEAQAGRRRAIMEHETERRRMRFGADVTSILDLLTVRQRAWVLHTLLFSWAEQARSKHLEKELTRARTVSNTEEELQRVDSSRARVSSTRGGEWVATLRASCVVMCLFERWRLAVATTQDAAALGAKVEAARAAWATGQLQLVTTTKAVLENWARSYQFFLVAAGLVCWHSISRRAVHVSTVVGPAICRRYSLYLIAQAWIDWRMIYRRRLWRGHLLGPQARLFALVTFSTPLGPGRGGLTWRPAAAGARCRAWSKVAVLAHWRKMVMSRHAFLQQFFLAWSTNTVLVRLSAESSQVRWKERERWATFLAGPVLKRTNACVLQEVLFVSLWQWAEVARQRVVASREQHLSASHATAEILRTERDAMADEMTNQKGTLEIMFFEEEELRARVEKVDTDEVRLRAWATEARAEAELRVAQVEELSQQEREQVSQRLALSRRQKEGQLLALQEQLKQALACAGDSDRALEASRVDSADALRYARIVREHLGHIVDDGAALRHFLPDA